MIYMHGQLVFVTRASRSVIFFSFSSGGIWLNDFLIGRPFKVMRPVYANETFVSGFTHPNRSPAAPSLWKLSLIVEQGGGSVVVPGALTT